MTRLSKLPAILLVLWCSMLSASYVTASSIEYFYRGNPFVELDSVTGLFSYTDHVSASFSIDCAAAHSEGNCTHLPYDDYLALGAIEMESLDFSAGPVVLPTPDGKVEVNVFSFSTDYLGRIVDWDMDLALAERWLNVDTDNVNGGLDSAAAPGESARVVGKPGNWGKELPVAQSDFDLAVSKTVDNSTPDGPQQAFEFTVSIANPGPGPAADVVVVDKLPPELAIPEGMAVYTSAGYYDVESGRWHVGDLANSLPQVMTIPAVVNTESQPACIINTASIEIGNDINPANNTSSVAVRLPDIQGCADLIIEELFLYQYVSTCEADFAVSFQVRVRNAGPDVAKNVVLEIEESLFEAPGLKIDNPNCEDLRCTWETMSVGQAQTIGGLSEHISISGTSDYFNVDESETWEIRAGVRGEEEDYKPDNNTSTALEVIDPHARAASCDINTGSGDWDLSGVGGGGGCFIATASFGHEGHPYVKTLRDFRDNVLMDSAWGRSAVEFYYRNSPGIASYIAQRENMRTIVRWLLAPVVLAITYPWSALIIFISLGVLLATALTRRHKIIA